ncbi:TraR/DksA C4-type zinc finger protein [Streptomyces sp. NPDC058685]|uniref:TraR/DksA C4-type zinc finger protein n=1 Tax=Streptomyces sp. NPDC058685 TaxID=3346598 RepID=UPI00364BE7A2
MSLDDPRIAPRLERVTAHEARERLTHERSARLTQLQAVEKAGQDTAELIPGQKGAIERALQEIDAALARVDDGTYGICRYCAEPIPAERLEILPYTPFCVPCQQPPRL